MKQVDVLYTNVFERNLEAYNSKKFRVIANQGSTRSSKTYSISQLLALYIPFNESKSISVVSPSLPHLKRGARRDILENLENTGIYSDDHFNKTDNIYNYPQTGSYIEFFGVEDGGKVRGPGRDILYVNEANLIPFHIYKQLALRTKDIIFLDFNPADEESWVYQVADNESNILIHSTYKDNPFLTKEQVQEIESLEDADENLWKVYGLGLRGTSSETIYTHWKVVDEMPNKGEKVYGQDFGYNVPSALVEIEFYEGGIYVDELLYEPKLTTGDLIERYKDLDIVNWGEIFCDAAEPKTIEELSRAGYNAKSADKDVTEGIRKVKSMPLYITKRSINVLKEIKSYKWKSDKNGKVLDEPVKFNDHCFVGNTVIETDKGISSLKNIREGDMVLTSQGFKKVLIKWNNGKHLTRKYRMQFDTFSVTLECTPDHLIKTNEGWQQIQKLKSGQTVYLNKNSIKRFINSTQMNGISIVPEQETECTLMFGDSTMEMCHADTTSIIKTKTDGIIESKIWNLNHQKNIYQIIQKAGQSTIKNGWKIFRSEELNQQRNGTKVRRVLSGTSKKQKNRVSGNLITESQNVNYVEVNIKSKQSTQDFVTLTARLKHLEQGKENENEVYDLTVEGAHEYFANGVLVHNCMDAIRYGVFTKLLKPTLNWTAF